VTTHIEQALPSNWNANALTFIGNVALYLAAITSIIFGGFKYHKNVDDLKTNDVPQWVFIMAAVCVQWFCWFDIMDGQRARRLKCGTPIGRIIDESGDSV